MALASPSWAWRVCICAAFLCACMLLVSASGRGCVSDVPRVGKASTGELSGSYIGDVAMRRCTSFAGRRFAANGCHCDVTGSASTESTAVAAPFVHGLPWDRSEGALEEGIVYYIALVVFAFDDPVAGQDFALTNIGEDDGWLSALFCFYEKRSAGPKCFQFQFS